jgi:hypothetical protein
MSSPQQKLNHYAGEAMRWVYTDPAKMAGLSASLAASYAFAMQPELRGK